MQTLIIKEDKYAAVNAPCGRFSMVVDGKTVAVDLWKNSARAESAPTNTATNALVADGDDEELPF